MALYRKKPVVIEAWKLNLQDTDDVIRLYEMVNDVDLSTVHMVGSAHVKDLINSKGGLPYQHYKVKCWHLTATISSKVLKVSFTHASRTSSCKRMIG